MTKKEILKLREIRENMINALHAAYDEEKLADVVNDKAYWQGQIVAYRDILRQLHYFPENLEFLSNELLAIYNS